MESPDSVQPNPAYPYLVALVAAVGGFLFGFDLSIVSGAQIFLKKQFQLSPEALGFACSCAMLGCMLGPPLIALGLSDWLGRKKVLMIMAIAFGVSAVGSAMPATIGLFNVFRILGGIAVGVASRAPSRRIRWITRWEAARPRPPVAVIRSLLGV